MKTCLQAESRTKINRSGLRKLRQSGQVPAIVFGKNTEAEMIHISSIAFKKWMRDKGSGFIQLQFGEERSLPVLLEDYQHDPVTNDIIHVDFQRVQDKEIIRTKIPVKYMGTPAATKNGGVVQVQSTFIEVESLPKFLPDMVELEISNLGIGETLSVKDVAFALEITVVSLPDEALISVVKP
ncbi:50S ribosomal protein L25 [Paenibacillus sp. J5C_2022]|uniref:50S ribosomal protein L25 n=1 Tax=Paenibacillus sp. J5C2022 TaxID=2977129 RepID=UPI0021D05FC0|nr:50S ribosomal protein L25 [Paenibacillus sp. J5C2022]MCU6712355.1 50S ribosomal protein L25 [Paenibacillus sp. J5C2022]